MRNIDINKICRIVIIILLFINIPVKSQESITAYTKYKHKIINDTIKTTRIAIDQKTYNKNGILIRDRIFDSISGKQVYYYLFFYNSNGEMISKEFYNMNKTPEYLITYTYDTDRDTIKKTTFIPNNDTVKIETITNYEYDLKKNLSNYKIYNYKNKLLQTVIFTYNSENKIIKKEITDKKCLLNDYKILISEYEYNADSLLIKEKKYLKNCNNKVFNTIINYKYEKGKCIEKSELSLSNELVKKEEFGYFNNGKLSKYYVYVNNNKPVKAFSFNESSHVIILGDMKSYWQ